MRYPHWRVGWLVGGVLWGVFGTGVVVSTQPQDLIFSASVDKTTVVLGDPIQLTLTISGDIAGVELPPLQLPEGIVVVGRSQSTNFSLHAGAVEQSMSVVYVLIPQRAGTLELGPFTVSRHQQQLKTSPIAITVKKAPFNPRPNLTGIRTTI